MNETKYTKDNGWAVDSWDVHDAVKIPKGSKSVMQGDYCVAIILADNDKPVNARVNLIAAAPELLEALKEACKAHLSANGTKPPQEWLIAVAKAEGRL